jgi:hypothetical protein
LFVTSIATLAQSSGVPSCSSVARAHVGAGVNEPADEFLTSGAAARPPDPHGAGRLVASQLTPPDLGRNNRPAAHAD